jgi:hypothetical protein
MVPTYKRRASMRQRWAAIFAVLIVSAHLLAASCRAQEIPSASNEYLAVADKESSPSELLPASNSQPKSDGSSDAGSPQGSSSSADDGWHVGVAPYLWFPGMHGSVKGAIGSGINFKASPGDLLSNFHFGLMGAVEASHKRLVLTGDMLWVRLEDEKATPFPGLFATSSTMKATEFFLAPKIGLRIVDQERIKIIASTGMRYWHLSQDVTFNPSTLGLDFGGSQDFVDPLVGGQIKTFLTPKVVVNVMGDVGGWGTGSQLEYQVGGTIGYKLNERWSLHTGYRYLYLDKNADHGFVFKAVITGVVLGVTINLK